MMAAEAGMAHQPVTLVTGGTFGLGEAIALELARRPDVRVSILSPSDQLLALVASYDPQGILHQVRLRRPPSRPDSLFRQPSRLATLLLNYATIARFPTLVTT